MRSLAVAALLLVVACAPDQAQGEGFVLSEWAIDGPDTLATAGEVDIAVDNAGEFPHTLIVTSGDGHVVGATGVIPPGTSATLELDLETGSYIFSCRIVTERDDGTISDHYQRGMYRTVDVG